MSFGSVPALFKRDSSYDCSPLWLTSAVIQELSEYCGRAVLLQGLNHREANHDERYM